MRTRFIRAKSCGFPVTTFDRRGMGLKRLVTGQAFRFRAAISFDLANPSSLRSYRRFSGFHAVGAISTRLLL